MTLQRREFIAGLGSAAVWPVVARAQQAGRLRRIGVLVNAWRMIRKCRPGLRRSGKGSANSDGRRAATSASTIAFQVAVRSGFRNSPRS